MWNLGGGQSSPPLLWKKSLFKKLTMKSLNSKIFPSISQENMRESTVLGPLFSLMLDPPRIRAIWYDIKLINFPSFVLTSRCMWIFNVLNTLMWSLRNFWRRWVIGPWVSWEVTTNQNASSVTAGPIPNVLSVLAKGKLCYFIYMYHLSVTYFFKFDPSHLIVYTAPCIQG